MIKNTVSCCTSIDDCVNSRRCFMTGEYCSKQTNIQKERKRFHEKGSIIAFVVMNFSNMSDVIYKWRIKGFIESLTKYLYVNTHDSKIMCWPSSKTSPSIDGQKWERIQEIKVIRADSNPASNYVICNRVCQQMQIADLVVIDVSSENTNVFYEFGMAVALGKMILPICYSESFYEMVIPDEKYKDKIEHHIGCYPWRKKLFEYYGIRYRSRKISTLEYIETNGDKYCTQYLPFEDATNKDYGFSDMQYNCFPYDEMIRGNSERIGKQIYDRLRKSYNNSCFEDNTLIVYTMDGFLNEGQAGRCIVNYYNSITSQMRKRHCFGGDRVGVLVQSNAIPENVKDSQINKNLLYSVGEIIHIGMNQATYIAQREKIKTRDFLNVYENMDEKINEEDVGWKKDIIRFVKEHIRNKCILIYPNNPVYVNRVKNGLQRDILTPNDVNENGNEFSLENYFCLYHVMLKTLSFTNEIVVDISNNSLQALFWLGAAHGSDINAITVRHEETDEERHLSITPKGLQRSIFDVAGLWTATLRSYDTDGFYHQLALVQLGIEQHTKLMLKNVEYYEERLCDQLYETQDPLSNVSKFDKVQVDIKKIYLEKEVQEEHALESYYRDQFWKPMLRYNRLWIYLPQVDDINICDGEPRIYAAKWDVDAIAVLSHYLSKRKIIGEYFFKALPEGEVDVNARNLNFICVGNSARPLHNESDAEQGKNEAVSLAEYITKKVVIGGGDNGRVVNGIHKWNQITKKCQFGDKPDEVLRYRGFIPVESHLQNEGVYTQIPQAKCHSCEMRTRIDKKVNESQIIRNADDLNKAKCALTDNMKHTQLAQLILWREVPETTNGRVYFRVSLIGVSGPATLALSTLLVDEDQKKEVFYKEGDVEKAQSDKWHVSNNMLSRLQLNIRAQLTNVYFERLKKELEKVTMEFNSSTINEEDTFVKQKDSYLERVLYAAGMYLSTVLYGYFLPFLSLEDEYRICMGMQTYVTYMMAANISPFSLNYPQDGDPRFSSSLKEESVREVVKTVARVLEDVLKSFRGVEALYQVKVLVEAPKAGGNHGGGDKDTRRIVGIEELETSTSTSVNCLFVQT